MSRNSHTPPPCGTSGVTDAAADVASPQVIITRRLYDIGDPGKSTQSELERLLKLSGDFWYYVTPMVTVVCSLPMPEFFEAVAQQHGAWFRQLRLHLGNNGWRSKRKITKGRDRRLEFDGLLIVFGVEVAVGKIPSLRRTLGQLPTLTERSADFRLVEAGDLDGLQRVLEREVHRCHHEDRLHNDNAYRILPGMTLRSPLKNAAFEREWIRRLLQWQRRARQLLPPDFNREELPHWFWSGYWS